jgi:hypothetical protein
VSEDHDFSADLTPAEYNLVSKRSVFRRYGFDLLVAREHSEEYRRYPRNFAVLAEGPVDEIRKLQADIDDYVSRLEKVPL